MDYTYLIIFFIALILYFLDRLHKSPLVKENYENFPSIKYGVNYGATSPEPLASQGLTNIKIPGQPKWKTGFRKFTPTPPNPRCSVTVLGENCSNYPQDTTNNQHQSICQKSYGDYPTGLQDFKAPLFVMGKSLTRSRICRPIYNPPKIS